jgi:hypothetical protein
MYTASDAPKMLPITVGVKILKASLHSIIPALKKDIDAMSAAINTGTRLVPLAMAGESPIKINTGRVTADPLDATVFRNPQRSPAPTAIMISIGIVKFCKII